jgi:hypothetical protein
MTQREQYLLRAAELSAKAQTESAAADKSEFENLARAYLRLAEQAERNLFAIACEKPPKKPRDQGCEVGTRKVDGDKG